MTHTSNRTKAQFATPSDQANPRAAPSRAPAARAPLPRTTTRTRTTVSTPHPDSTETRIRLAEADVQAIDDTNLSTASSADLVGLIVRARGSLVDLIRLCREAPPN